MASLIVAARQSDVHFELSRVVAGLQIRIEHLDSFAGGRGAYRRYFGGGGRGARLDLFPAARQAQPRRRRRLRPQRVGQRAGRLYREGGTIHRQDGGRQPFWDVNLLSPLRARDQYRPRRRYQGRHPAVRPVGLEGPARFHLLPGRQRDGSDRPRRQGRARRIR
jgi:hypothetical protein